MDEFSTPNSRSFNSSEFRLAKRVITGFARHKVHGTKYAAEKIIEVVGNATCHQAHALQLLPREGFLLSLLQMFQGYIKVPCPLRHLFLKSCLQTAEFKV